MTDAVSGPRGVKNAWDALVQLNHAAAAHWDRWQGQANSEVLEGLQYQGHR